MHNIKVVTLCVSILLVERGWSHKEGIPETDKNKASLYYYLNAEYEKDINVDVINKRSKKLITGGHDNFRKHNKDIINPKDGFDDDDPQFWDDNQKYSDAIRDHKKHRHNGNRENVNYIQGEDPTAGQHRRRGADTEGIASHEPRGERVAKVEPRSRSDELLPVRGSGRETSNSMQRTQAHQGCALCRDREEVKRMRLEIIKSEILKKLRLDSPPNVTGIPTPTNPPFLNQLRRFNSRSQQQHTQPMGRRPQDDEVEEDNFHAETTKEFIFAERSSSQSCRNENCIHFSFGNRSRVKILNAYLFIYTRNFSNLETSFIKINRVRRNGADQIGVRRLGEEQKNGWWHKFSILRLVQSWSRNPDNNFGLQVVINNVNGRSLAVTQPETEADKPLRPTIYMTIQKKKMYRKKRMIHNRECSEYANSNHCCRHSLTVDFQAFQWDFVIAPKTYEAYFCTGDCPYQFMQTYFHTHVTQQQHALNISSDATGPCCTPAKFLPISMLYFADNVSQTIKIADLSDMVVERCQCV
ncbi:unnamed protein product [Owenia fusiformis]|uniref:Uncharacterized protein n=1 Tax=Owenia fusiformis TaxID=6347 RepID=A0A8J1Y3B4_OWEFU|nr:unnamed protein product [Owenia fusiformis]